MNLRRFLGSFAKTTLAIGALSVSAFAGADDYHYNDHFNNGCNPCPQQCASSCCGMPVIEAPCLGWAYNPPAYARCANCDTNCNNSFFDTLTARVDFLWWRASEEGIQLGTEEFSDSFVNDPDPVRTTVFNRSHVKHPNFKYDPGFRLGLINACACDCYDIAFNWTHYHTKAKVNGASDEDEGITFFSDWERLVDVNALAASATYTLNLDMLDLELGRKFYVSNCFVLRPSVGLRGVRLDQNYRVESEANLDSTSPIPQLSDFLAEVKSRSDFLAIGPRVGLDVEVHLGCGLAIFGQAAGAIVFGKFDNHSREAYRDFATVTSPTPITEFGYEAKSSAHRTSRTITDLAIGLRWDHCFEWCNRYHPVGIAFAWEHHAFYDMNDFNFAERGFELGVGPNGAVGRKHGDLYTQGLTVSATFGF